MHKSAEMSPLFPPKKGRKKKGACPRSGRVSFKTKQNNTNKINRYSIVLPYEIFVE
jgi:hypothetical protein